MGAIWQGEKRDKENVDGKKANFERGNAVLFSRLSGEVILLFPSMPSSSSSSSSLAAATRMGVYSSALASRREVSRLWLQFVCCDHFGHYVVDPTPKRKAKIVRWYRHVGGMQGERQERIATKDFFLFKI